MAWGFFWATPLMVKECKQTKSWVISPTSLGDFAWIAPNYTLRISSSWMPDTECKQILLPPPEGIMQFHRLACNCSAHGKVK
jgi:hypothetical protein